MQTLPEESCCGFILMQEKPAKCTDAVTTPACCTCHAEHAFLDGDLHACKSKGTPNALEEVKGNEQHTNAAGQVPQGRPSKGFC